MKTYLRLALLATLVFTTTTLSAFADFRPGRVRPGKIADMRVTGSMGIFEGYQKAKVALNFEDGKAAPVSFTVSIPGFATTSLKIEKIEPGVCNDLYVAAKRSADNSSALRMELRDYSDIECRPLQARVWHIRIQALDGSKQVNELKLEGNPEDLYVTQ